MSGPEERIFKDAMRRAISYHAAKLMQAVRYLGAGLGTSTTPDGIIVAAIFDDDRMKAGADPNTPFAKGGAMLANFPVGRGEAPRVVLANGPLPPARPRRIG